VCVCVCKGVCVGVCMREYVCVCLRVRVRKWKATRAARESKNERETARDSER